MTYSRCVWADGRRVLDEQACDNWQELGGFVEGVFEGGFEVFVCLCR